MRLTVIKFLGGLLFFFNFMACQKVDVSSEKLPPLASPTAANTTQQITFMSSIIEENPQVAEYYYRRSLLFYENNQLVAAQQDIEKALSLDKNNGNFFFVKALILAQSKQPLQALSAALMAETKGLRKVDLFLLLSRLYYETSQPIQAVLYLRKVKEILPNNAEVYYYQGLISYDVADTLNTVRYMEKALSFKTDYLEAYTYLIKLYLKNAKPTVALRYLQKAMQDATMAKNAGLNKMYGDVLQQLDRKEEKAEIIAWYEKAVALDSTQWEAAYAVAQYYLSKKNYPTAANYLEKALKTRKNIEGGYYLLAAVYEYHIKNFAQAKNAYQIAQQLQPLNTNIQADIARMERRIAYEEYKKTPEYQRELAKRKQEESKLDSINLMNTPAINEQK